MQEITGFYSPTEQSEMTLSESSQAILANLRDRHIPRLEAMLAEQKASGALKKDIANDVYLRMLVLFDPD